MFPRRNTGIKHLHGSVPFHSRISISININNSSLQSMILGARLPKFDLLYLPDVP